MNKYKFLALILLVTLSTVKTQAQNDVANTFKFAAKQTELMLTEVDQAKAQNPNSKLVVPRNIENGKLTLISAGDWCSGFFPGELWYLYDYTKDPKWLKQAQAFTPYIESQKSNAGSHDVGFQIYCSFGNGYRLTKDPHYKDVIIEAAKTLTTRFNPVVGSIKSWDNLKVGKFPVIIDNMMNLELLFEATRLSGDSTFYKVAIAHANTAMKNHFRADYSSYHVVNYDAETGKVIRKFTHQGYADESAWARGQAWGLYGYTMCYRETKDKKYLQQAEHIAQFIFSNPNLPKDLIPYWDYNLPSFTDAPRDVSAATIAASALYELSTYSANGKTYLENANKIIKNLKAYQPKPGDGKGFLLLHSTGNMPVKGEVDVPIIYADYYYMEALLRKQHLENHQPVIK